jgi:hypothetical protein
LNSQKWLTGGSTAWKSVQVYMSKLTANFANELEPTSNWQGKFDTEAKVEDADENPIGPIGIEKKTPGSGISALGVYKKPYCKLDGYSNSKPQDCDHPRQGNFEKAYAPTTPAFEWDTATTKASICTSRGGKRNL